MAQGGLFISYSHKDRNWLKEFHTHLDPLVRRGLVLWDDTSLTPGTFWEAEIQEAIARCQAALLLVSPDFLASDFILQRELGPLLEARSKTDLGILWVHLRACMYAETAISGLQAAHDPSAPLAGLSRAKREAALVLICERVRDMVFIDRIGASPSLPVSAEFSSTKPARYVLVLSGSISIEDKPVVDALLANLRAVARDSRLQLVQIRSGSVHLTLEGTIAGFMRFQEAMFDDRLANVLGHQVYAVYPLGEDARTPSEQVRQRALSARQVADRRDRDPDPAAGASVPPHKARSDNAARHHDNPPQRTPCMLVLDASASMEQTIRGTTRRRIDELNDALVQFQRGLAADETAAQRVQIAIVCVGGASGEAQLLLDWTEAASLEVPHLTPGGTTPLGKGMQLALGHIDKHKKLLKREGIIYTRPWIMVMTDGSPTDEPAEWNAAVKACRDAEALRRCVIYPIGIGDADVHALQQLSSMPAIRLAETRFREMYQWLSSSLASVSRSRPGEKVTLAAVDPWATL